MDSIICDTDGCPIRRIPVYQIGTAPYILRIPMLVFKGNIPDVYSVNYKLTEHTKHKNRGWLCISCVLSRLYPLHY